MLLLKYIPFISIISLYYLSRAVATTVLFIHAKIINFLPKSNFFNTFSHSFSDSIQIKTPHHSIPILSQFQPPFLAFSSPSSHNLIPNSPQIQPHLLTISSPSSHNFNHLSLPFQSILLFIFAVLPNLLTHSFSSSLSF